MRDIKMNTNTYNYKVAEKFVSINGEGKRAGELAVFIRFAHCNLNCSYCDTSWANKEDVSCEMLSIDDIVGYIKECRVNNVTLTGGEPLFREGIKQLISALSKEDINVEIETNGAVSLGEYTDIGTNVSFTMDYKLPGSGMEEFMCTDNFDLLRECDSVKFVVSDLRDLNRAREIIKKYNLDERLMVFLSSSFGMITPEQIVNYMIENNMNNVRIQLQLHKYIWDADKRGV